jgi:hypothetical protein
VQVFGGSNGRWLAYPTRSPRPPPAAVPSTSGDGSSSAARRSTKPYVPFFGAFGAAWDNAMVARWNANPVGMLWPERDAAFMSAGGGHHRWKPERERTVPGSYGPRRRTFISRSKKLCHMKGASGRANALQR